MQRILIVEDDAALGAGLRFDLEAEGYRAVLVATVAAALEMLKGGGFDLALLDLDLPDGSGYDVCKAIREEGDMPVIFLTANTMERNEAIAFDLGADDYVTKPFSMALLRRRVAAVLARTGDKEPAAYNDGALQVDLDRMQVVREGEAVSLTATEARLLAAFLRAKGQVLTRTALLERLWDEGGSFVDEHALTVNVSRLRAKLVAGGHEYIKTVYGVGYQWNER